jgi:DNA-binding protein HU-beta
MNKQELIEAVAKRTGLSRVETTTAVDRMIETIRDAVAAGGNVQLVGFGGFVAPQRAARSGRNPATGKPIDIAAARSVRFVPCKAFRDAVNG